MTPQKPLARAKERSPGGGRGLAGAALPGDRQAGQSRGGRDLLGRRDRDLRQDQIGRSYAPRGATPVVVRTAKRVPQSMISAVSNAADALHALRRRDERRRFIAFLRRLIRDAGQKVFLIVDKLKVHHAARSRRGWRRTPTDRAVLPAGLRTRPQPRRVPEQRPEAEAAPAAPARLERRAAQEHPCGAARHPALTSPHPDLLQAAQPFDMPPECQVYPWDISSLSSYGLSCRGRPCLLVCAWLPRSRSSGRRHGIFPRRSRSALAQHRPRPP